MKSSIIYIVALCFFSCSLSDEKEKKNYIGQFLLDKTQSDLGTYKDSTPYHNLVLTIKNNDSFYLSMPAPFFAAPNGKYELRKTGEFYWLYLIYVEDEITLEDQVGITVNGDIYINNTRPRKGFSNLPRVVFKKLNTRQL